jgi:hypothetical protein
LKMEDTPIDLRELEIHAEHAEVVTWQGREALRLENGLALVPKNRLKDASIEVLVGTDGPAYSGVAFRVSDNSNYELAYAVPHVSGQWDALQYDPIFHGSNTWQVYHGAGYQQEAQVPTGRWFHLKVNYWKNKVAVSVDGGFPLVVTELAHPILAGGFGLWTYRPAHFSELRVSACEEIAISSAELPSKADGVLETWLVEGYGVVTCEPNGVVNLNRYFPTSMKKARLMRHFETSEEAEIMLTFGFSDALKLTMDDEEVFKGQNTFTGFEDRTARGYAELGTESVRKMLAPGSHYLTAELEVSEGFGWGLVLSAHGGGLRWLPAELS